MAASDSPIAALARQHLPPDVAETWVGLLRPAIWLRANRAGDRVVGHLGGVPALPVGIDWPTWDGHGPLSFIATVDCGELPSRQLDIDLPERGALLFFYFDGQNGDEAFWGPGRQAGARVTYVPEGTAATERSTPREIDPYPQDHADRRPRRDLAHLGAPGRPGGVRHRGRRGHDAGTAPSSDQR